MLKESSMIGVIITAGGSGRRMNKSSVPKQFLNLNGKPVIAHAIDVYQRSDKVDYIIISCKEGWGDHLHNIVLEHNFSKVIDIVLGGSTNQISIYNALTVLRDKYEKSGAVIVSDGVRPFISQKDVESCVSQVLLEGNSVAVSQCIETIATASHDNEKFEIINRNRCKVVKAPQAFMLSDMLDMHKKSLEDNINSFHDSASMFFNYGKSLNYFECSCDNIKITTAWDFFMAESILKTKFDLEVLGVSLDFK